MLKENNRMNYLDGMKGICLISIMIFHFMLQFLPLGYVGWSCPDEGATNPVSYYFQYFPYSILSNNSYGLYIFMGIASFIPAYKFFQDGKTASLQKQVVTRYFRLMPMTLVACLISVLFFHTNITPFHEFFEVTKNNWINGRIDAFDYTVLNAFKDGLWSAYVNGTNAVSSLWCLHYFFLGTLLTSAILLLFGNMKKRGIIYCVLVALLWNQPAYLSFLACIASADLVCHRCKDGRTMPYALMIVLGIAIGLFPPVLLPEWMDITVPYAIGCFGVVTGVSVLLKNNKLLCSKYICQLGQKSFSAIIIHCLVLFSVNEHLYLWLNREGLAFSLNIATNFIVFMTLTFVFTALYDLLLTPLTDKLCKKVYSFVAPIKESKM